MRVKWKVLVVDDEEGIRLNLSQRIEAAGYQVFEASSGWQALTIAKQEIPNLVILDLMMPQMSGYQVWRKFKEDKSLSHIPFLILTAKNRITDKFWGASMPMHDYIQKPYKEDYLIKRIREKVAESLLHISYPNIQTTTLPPNIEELLADEEDTDNTAPPAEK